MKVIKYFLIVFSGLLFLKCTNENAIEPLPLYLNDVSPKNACFGQQVKLFGQGFGSSQDSSFVLFDTIKIQATQCDIWTNASISFIAPKQEGVVRIRVVVNGDTSNSKSINIERYPSIEFVEVPAGSFLIGSVNGFENERPTRQIFISKPFFISKYEISILNYSMLVTGTYPIVENPGLPASGISWLDAIKFCNSLSLSEGFGQCYKISNDTVLWDTSANGFRLPTEAEWEYACRAGSKSSYSGNGVLDDMGWYSANSGHKIHPSGKKQANSRGIYDMHGNLWEWCWDYFYENYYQFIDEYDPKGPADGDIHCLRGGAYDCGEVYARSANRTYQGGFDNKNVGIRLVRNKP